MAGSVVCEPNLGRLSSNQGLKLENQAQCRVQTGHHRRQIDIISPGIPPGRPPLPQDTVTLGMADRCAIASTVYRLLGQSVPQRSDPHHP